MDAHNSFDALLSEHLPHDEDAKRLKIHDTMWIKLCADNKWNNAQVDSVFAARANGLDLSKVGVKECLLRMH